MGVACVTYGQEFIWGNLDDRDRPYEALCGGRIILKWILKKELKGVDLINLTQVAGCCRHGNEPYVFHNEFYDWMCKFWLQAWPDSRNL